MKPSQGHLTKTHEKHYGLEDKAQNAIFASSQIHITLNDSNSHKFEPVRTLQQLRPLAPTDDLSSKFDQNEDNSPNNQQNEKMALLTSIATAKDDGPALVDEFNEQILESNDEEAGGK